MKRTLNPVFFFLVLAISPPAMAAPETPATLKGAAVVSARQAQALQQTGALMVDARVALEYVEEHIHGAVNIPYKEKSAKAIHFNASLDQFDIKKLPADKKAPVIFYCNAGKCWKSYKAAKAAVRNGHKTVYWLRGGIPEWKQEGLPIE